eukprot:5005985-Amphidinium_carterae.2
MAFCICCDIAVSSKSSAEIVRVLKHVMGARTTYKIMISDSAPEMASAASLLQMAHVPLTP